ncbi:ParB/RepB/Spo0J family partition protein [Luteimonas sp. SDU101]|uniref:ParB/RepB/Spo0J family partition protein n=1 Tax=Luteimonas sp. SDU101 TaxID=3422593 RepID=UPI003EBA376F
MAESIASVDTRKVSPNPENPRLIFHQDELEALQDSIEKQGILVPLTVYEERGGYVILDGERRWRCAMKLGLESVPAIIQPKPAPLQNLMMMFAIHHRRNEWDPLPTALKLEKLEQLYLDRYGVGPTESQLAEIASLTRGEVRRYKKLLRLPFHYRQLLMDELAKPRSQQVLTVDHVLEATAAAAALRKRGVVDDDGEDLLRRVIVERFQKKQIESTVDPRKFARLARAVDREEVTRLRAKSVIKKFVNNPGYTIADLFRETVEAEDYRHSVEMLVDRTSERLRDLRSRNFELSDSLKVSLQSLLSQIKQTLRG